MPTPEVLQCESDLNAAWPYLHQQRPECFENEMASLRSAIAARLGVDPSLVVVDVHENCLPAAQTIQRWMRHVWAKRGYSRSPIDNNIIHVWWAAATIQRMMRWSWDTRGWWPPTVAARWDAAQTIQRAWCLHRYGPYECPDSDDGEELPPLVGDEWFRRQNRSPRADSPSRFD